MTSMKRETLTGDPIKSALLGDVVPDSEAGACGGATKLLVQDTAAWRLLHVAAFLLGGTTFCAGTAYLYAPASDTTAPLWSAALYTVGSVGFLSVDVQEFFTYTADAALRTNIACSAAGSLLYVVGSLGFIPTLYAITPAPGELGFVLGSAAIGLSQAWKTARLGWTGASFSPAKLLRDVDTATAVGVEASAGVGAWCFFAGTVIYTVFGPAPEGAWLAVVLATWCAGSAWFTIGGLFLAYRHIVMGVS